MKFTVQYEGQKMNRKLISFCLRTDAQTEGGKEKKTKKDHGCGKLEKFLQLQAACPCQKNRVGAGIFPINSNRNLNTAIRASRYNAIYMYICVYILGAGSGRLSVSDFNPPPRFFEEWSFT